MNIVSGKIGFANPYVLLLLLFIPLGFYLIRRYRRAAMIYPVTRRFANTMRSIRVILWRTLPYIWAVGLGLLIVAAARPRAGFTVEKKYTKGIDIVIALDISSSMYAVDFQPKNRIEVAKLEAKNFIKGRPNDRIGLVVFASKAFPQCPLTIDHNILLQLLDKVSVGDIEDGTAIGDAIITAAGRLRNSKAKSKVIILLTDGRNNTGKIDPITAAQAAAALGIKIYTIGMGKRGKVLYPVKDVFGRTRLVPMDIPIDEDALRQIASSANGKYFRATSREKLRKIYQEIDKLEKTKIIVKRFKRYKELFYYPLIAGFILVLIAIVFEYLVVRQIP